jgi:hypothetical protein
MKEKRDERLYFINCLLQYKLGNDVSKLERSIVDIITSWSNFNDVVKSLFDLDKVTKFYSKRNVLVDLWYMTNKSISNSINLGSMCGKDLTESLLFLTIIQALKDVRTGRPCDFSAWHKDKSPDGLSCTSGEHICYANAEEYLNGVKNSAERVIGIREGCIDDMIKGFKKEPMFSIGSIFD